MAMAKLKVIKRCNQWINVCG